MSRSTYEVTNLQQTRSPRSKFATTTNQASKRYTRCLIIWRAPPASGCALASAAHVKKSMHTHTICQRGELSNVTIQCLKNWNMARSEELWNHARSGAPLHNLPGPCNKAVPWASVKFESVFLFQLPCLSLSYREKNRAPRSRWPYPTVRAEALLVFGRWIMRPVELRVYLIVYIL